MEKNGPKVDREYTKNGPKLNQCGTKMEQKGYENGPNNPTIGRK